MSMEFMFAVVPFERDGNLCDLYDDVPFLGYLSECLKEGVEIVKTEGEQLIPSPLGLSLSINGVQHVDHETGGMFLGLTDGAMNQRYVLLAPRRKALDILRAAVPQMSTEFRRKFLEMFVHNCDAVLERYGDRAALLIL